MKAALAIFLGISLVLSACGPRNEVEKVTLKNGVTLTLHEQAKLQNTCVIMGERLPESDLRHCIEGSSSDRNEEFVPENWYAAQLVEQGFQWVGGAANQYWLDWPLSEGCHWRLNLTGVPKEHIEGDDWSQIEVYVIVFEFGDLPTCEKE